MVTPLLRSRLPRVGVTIFTQMSALAAQHGAINLGQGFPDFDGDPLLIAAITRAMQAGNNQYPLMAGVMRLREAVVAKIAAVHGRAYCPDTEITITAGATQAILTAVLSVVHPGDEVIVLEPCYDSYIPNIELAGAKAVRVALTPGTFRPDFEHIAAALTAKTRAIIINSPHNPSATAWTVDEMQALERLLARTDVWIISDEVYEHMAFVPQGHQSVSRFPNLAERALVISSFGKTLHVTGWKVGYVAAPAELTREFRKVHQFNVFTVNTPMQLGLADYLFNNPQSYTDLPAFYKEKRDYFRAGLASTRFDVLPCEGTYFQCVRTEQINELDEVSFCKWLTQDVGVTAIPLSAFYADEFDQHIVRFCFAKKNETLKMALNKLAVL